MVDVLNAMEMFEALGQAVKEAGNGKFNGFLLAEAMRERGYRIVLERLPNAAGPLVPVAPAMAEYGLIEAPFRREPLTGGDHQ